MYCGNLSFNCPMEELSILNLTDRKIVNPFALFLIFNIIKFLKIKLSLVIYMKKLHECTQNYVLERIQDGFVIILIVLLKRELSYMRKKKLIIEKL